MKNVLRLLVVAAAVASFTLPAFAQDASTGAAAASAQDIQARADLYAKFLKEKAGNAASQKQASETGKEYLTKYAAGVEEALKSATDAEKTASTEADKTAAKTKRESAEADKKIVDYIRNWVAKYEKVARDFEFTESFDKKDYAKTFELGRAQLNEQPDNIGVLLLLTRAGYNNVLPGGTNNKSLNPETARMARRALDLIESGKAPDKLEPFPSRDEAVGFLQYTLGLVTAETSPADASAFFIKAAQSNSIYKNQPSTFTKLATIYEANELKKLVDEYNAAFPPGKEITDDLKPKYDQMLAQIGRVQDRIIDAYARAVAVMGNDPKFADSKKSVMKTLTAYYKARHEGSSDAEVQELINNVPSKPIPIAGQEPVTAVAPATSPGTPGATPMGQPASSTSMPKPAAGTAPKPAATPMTNTPAKPAATTPPASTTPKPKPVSKKTTPAAKPVGRKTTSGR